MRLIKVRKKITCFVFDSKMLAETTIKKLAELGICEYKTNPFCLLRQEKKAQKRKQQPEL